MWTLARHRNMMGLDVEDEGVFAAPCGRCRLQDFCRLDAKERSEDRIHRGKRQCHTTRATKKLTPIHAQIVRRRFGICRDLLLQTALTPGLRVRHLSLRKDKLSGQGYCGWHSIKRRRLRNIWRGLPSFHGARVGLSC